MPTSNSAYLPIEGTDFYEKIHKEITSLIASEKKKGTTKDDIQLQVNVYLNQQINELRAPMEKEGLPAQKIEETATTTFHQMNRIVMEIMKNSWLQDLKNECEALIEDEQEKKTASKMILKKVNVLIDQKIKALEPRNENEKLSQEEEEQIYHKLFAEVRKSIGPLLLEKQVVNTLKVPEFIGKVLQKCKDFIVKNQQEKGPKIDISLEIYNFINNSIALLDEAMQRNEVPPEEITETVSKAYRELQESVYPLLLLSELELDVAHLHGSWLQDLKKECEALIEDKQEKETTSQGIKEQVDDLIRQKIKALVPRNANEKLSQEEEQIYQKLFAEVGESIRPLLLEKQVVVAQDEKDLRTLKLTINASHRNSPPPPSPSSPSSPSPDSPPVLPRLFRRP